VATPLHFTSIGWAFLCVCGAQSGLQVIDPFRKLTQMQEGNASKLFADILLNELTISQIVCHRYKSMSGFHQRISISMNFQILPSIFPSSPFSVASHLYLWKIYCNN